ncbi:hypothetical protein [Sanguibacter sp. 25GB23B1]|uniref:hypothetical protein n=1 Tax=unclassified Sanguibacter TaxID=2645534 RepID=UPI0032AFA548
MTTGRVRSPLRRTEELLVLDDVVRPDDLDDRAAASRLARRDSSAAGAPGAVLSAGVFGRRVTRPWCQKFVAFP